MPKWAARFAIDIMFTAADANEAGEIAKRMHENPPATWCGHPILGRTPYYVAEIIEETDSSQDDAPAKERQ